MFEIILNRQKVEISAMCIGHILGRNCLQRHVLEGKKVGTIER
jgi:hypothetical protein